jgi:hypothetical protein
MATRPLAAPFGTMRFSETLGTFQLANADGTEIITPESTIEQAFQKLSLVEYSTPLKSRQNLFNRPFNTIFMPAEYASINCCFSCSVDLSCRSGLTTDGDTSSCCPPCDPPRPTPVTTDPPPPPVPTSLKMVSADFIPGTHLRGCDPAKDFAIVIAIKYQVLDQGGNALASASMEPQERIINFIFDGLLQPDPVPNPVDIGPTQYPGTSKLTDVNGQFIDAPFGQCTNTAFTNTFDQPITIIFNGTTYPVRTNKWSIQSAAVGQGFINNGNDIKLTK